MLCTKRTTIPSPQSFIDCLSSIDPYSNVIGLFCEFTYWYEFISFIHFGNFSRRERATSIISGLMAREMPRHALMWFKPTALLLELPCYDRQIFLFAGSSVAGLDHPCGSSPWKEIAVIGGKGREKEKEGKRGKTRREIPTRVRTRKKVA